MTLVMSVPCALINKNSVLGAFTHLGGPQHARLAKLGNIVLLALHLKLHVRKEHIVMRHRQFARHVQPVISV